MRRISIEEYKKIVLDVLLKIDCICRKNGLEYFLAYGTLLGAIRHNGFIPWDDDVDIIMLRKDYEKLRKIINSGSYGISFFDITTNSSTIYPFGKVCDNNSLVKEHNFKQMDGYGAFVDVFPFDYLPADKNERWKYCRKYRRKEIIITHSARTGYGKSGSIFRIMLRSVAYYSCKAFNPHKMIKKMNDAFLHYNNENKTGYVGIPWSLSGLAFPEDFFIGHKEHEFEGYSFYIPQQYDYLLRCWYNDYMKLPPVEKRVNKHDLECYIKD